MKEKLVIKHGSRKVSLEVKKCSFIQKGIGLMFSRRESAETLLFEFNNSGKMGIHSYFVFFDFLAVWLDSKNKVVQIDHVKPWVAYLCPKKKYSKLVEIPINQKNLGLIKKILK
jgi:uncharacterized membrane protein (UPF0127 family)